jgi:hypothetical protein
MYIDNEEVVCNKEFTIKEEMLSTSSTILNNCYPKSWEQDHDYISRFYYPKDYSKCLIYNQHNLLPDEYTQVDYIQSSGTQYIDMGVTPTTTTDIEINFTKGSSIINWQKIFGQNQEVGNKRYQLEINNQNLTSWNMTIAGTSTNFSMDANNWVTFKFVSGTGVYVNNELVKSISATEENNYNIWLFRGYDRYSNIKISSTKIYQNNVLVRDFIPCYRNSDNEVGLYDLVNDVFYTNQGTGDFTYNQVQETIINDLIFAGMVKNSGDISLNPREPKYCSLEILDFKDFLSTGDMLDFVISNKTITEAISMVVDAINQYGFVLGNVNINNSEEIIGAYSTLNKTAYDVFQYLADISGSRWTTRMIDENTVAIDFYDPTLMPSGTDIEYTKEWWCTNKVLDLTFNYGTRDYRNKQVMLSDEVYGGVDYDETIIADGYNTNYITTTNIAEIKAISVNGTPMTFATTYDKELGVEADFYYTFGNNTIETNETYLAGTVINIGYTPLVKGREVVSNEDEINRVSNNTGRKGVIARYENRNDVLSSNELKMIGETYIKYKGSAEVIITLKTRTDIYNVGQSVYFDAPIEELSTEYMVKKKSIEYIANINKIFYTYELSSSFNSEAAINWFDNQRNKATGNIAEGESITRNIDIESKATIVFSNATATEITITDTNVLNAPLNAPFTQ